MGILTIYLWRKPECFSRIITAPHVIITEYGDRIWADKMSNEMRKTQEEGMGVDWTESMDNIGLWVHYKKLFLLSFIHSK